MGKSFDKEYYKRLMMAAEKGVMNPYYLGGSYLQNILDSDATPEEKLERIAALKDALLEIGEVLG